MAKVIIKPAQNSSDMKVDLGAFDTAKHAVRVIFGPLRNSQHVGETPCKRAPLKISWSWLGPFHVAYIYSNQVSSINRADSSAFRMSHLIHLSHLSYLSLSLRNEHTHLLSLDLNGCCHAPSRSAWNFGLQCVLANWLVSDMLAWHCKTG